jgi:transposase
MRSEAYAPKKMENLHNAPTHRSVLIKDFMAKDNVTTLDHPPYSPDLTPADFYLFP